MVFSQSIVVVSWAFLLEGILMWVRTALFTSLTSYRSWLIELVRVTARRLVSSMTLLGGAPVNLLPPSRGRAKSIPFLSLSNR